MPNIGYMPGDSFLILIELPGWKMKIEALLEILHINHGNICHCRFKEIREESQEAIHQYILRRQKETLRKIEEKV
jgi:hypothetical protein